jgi:hypothetical protein
LKNLDFSNGSVRYELYLVVFDIELMVRNVGEVLMWLYSEETRTGKAPSQVLMELFLDAIAKPQIQEEAQKRGHKLLNPSALLLQLIVREFEDFAVEHEVSAIAG